MIDVLFDAIRRIALVRFSGPLTAADLQGVGVVGRQLAEREAPAWRIIDFSAVEQVQVATQVFAGLGMAPAVEGNRIYVVPNPELFGLARLYAAYQRHSGSENQPVLVTTLAEACATIGVTPDFEPYDVNGPTT